MINNTTEDYVSFEVAKLLKEKGFSAYCTSLYTKEGKQNDVGNYNGVDDDNYISYSRPTHALTIKWIRENFQICFEVLFQGRCVDGFNYHRVKIYNSTSGLMKILNDYDKCIEKNEEILNWSSEEAIEAALLYTLQNLIP